MAKDTLNIADLKQHEQNANRHTERGRSMLANSLREYGAGRSIVLDKNGVIIAGNLTAEYAAECGISNVRVVKTTGNELVAVMRTDLDITTDRKAKELALADNRVAQVSIDLDPVVLQALEAEGVNMEQFFSSDELTALMATDEAAQEPVETPVPELKSVAITKTGDVYEFTLNGMTSRLMCGDSTNGGDVALLMQGKKAAMLFTDPPYNIAYTEFNNEGRGGAEKAGKDWSEVYCTAWKDEMSDDDYAQFLNAVLRNAKDSLITDAHYYVWYAAKYYVTLTEAFRANGVSFDSIPLVWVKQTFTMSWAHYHRQYEPCIVGGKGMPTVSKRWFGPKNETNVWEISTEHNSTYIHPTQKPVALVQRALLNSSEAGDLILDLFAGSGSTLLASVQNARYCYTIEQEPLFCDAVVRRMISYCETAAIPLVLKRNGEIINPEEFQCAE